MGKRQPRLLSYSEIQTALTCWAQWDFKYGGRLAGSTLKKKETAAQLVEGTAWGAAVAAWHSHGGELFATWEAHNALNQAIADSAAQAAEVGFPVPAEEQMEMGLKLGAMLDHYATIAEPLPNFGRIEAEIVVGVPSRGQSARSSTRYRFQAFLDGFSDDDGAWLVEFKLRGRLTKIDLMLRQPQPKLYAWAYFRETGQMPSGVYVEERLNAIPKPAALTEKGRKPSHKKEQMTTPELYADLCHEFGEMPKLEVMDYLRARPWQQRIPLSYRPSEIEGAGRDLVSAAKLIRDLDSGELTPIRNAQRSNCDYCRFSEICTEPTDSLFVESLFERTVPKRLREPKEIAA
jgi:hypothetical protein